MIAAAGEIKRNLSKKIDNKIDLPPGFLNAQLVSDGNLIIEGKLEIQNLIFCLENQNLDGIGLITLVDDANFIIQDFSNWLWVTFTRSNPGSDIYGLHSETINKHFSCSIPMIDARIKKHHAPILER